MFFFHSLKAGGSLCSEVLGTAVSVVRALPPLSLAVESKLPRVGLASLSQLTTFLAETAKPSSPADPTGKITNEHGWEICANTPTFHFIGTENKKKILGNESLLIAKKIIFNNFLKGH